MYNIVCLKHGTKYTPAYVNNLYAGVKRNTTLPFQFHCFTDDAIGLHEDIVTHPLPHKKIAGWWQKLYLFSNEIPLSGRVLYLDLDTLIIDNIDNFITYDHDFVILRDLWAGGDNVGSAIISFELSKHVHIWDSFITDHENIIKGLHPHGDQKWIQHKQLQRSYWQDIFPGTIFSFKLHCRNGLPSSSKIVCFHGIPSIEESISSGTAVQGMNIPISKWVNDFWHSKDI